MKNEELCYRALRKKTEQFLATMPLEDRVEYLAQKQRRSIMLAKKHGLNVCTSIKDCERSNTNE